MKKNKLVGLAALFLTLGMVGCGEKPVEPCEKHSWGKYETVVEATCTTKGSQKRVCTVCGAEETKEVNTKSHTYVADTSKPEVPSTCTEAGKKFEKCSVCGLPRETALPLASHAYVAFEDADHVTVAATCDVAGKHYEKCSVCNDIQELTDNATGHTYAKDEDGNDVVTWKREADCTHAGSGTKECTVCHAKADVNVDALGHLTELIGTETQRVGDKAAVRMYKCSRCNDEFLGFKADEVTARSEERLVIGEDGGARFFGHPIGNDVELNEAGDPSESSHEAVFNKEQLGDFFEYVFDLDAAQAAKLSTAKLYCEADAAQWMSNNRMDFWACKTGDTDWTRGMYIETTDTHTEGEEIDDYRYILYVDDQVQDFDKSISVPAQANGKKVEYVLPYTFHLHEGTNKIRLVMAGGYRSVFYNFIFRPYEEAPVDPVDPVDPVGPSALVFTNGVAKIECEDCTTNNVGDAVTSEDLTYLSIPEQTWPQLSAEYKILISEDVSVELSLKHQYIKAPWGNNGAAELYIDGVRTKANSVDNLGQDLSVSSDWVVSKSSVFNLTAGEHTIKLQGPGGVQTNWDYFELAIHEHSFNESNECSCGAKRMVIAANSATSGSLDGSGKLKKGATSNKYDGSNPVTYTVTMDKACKVELSAKVWVDNAANWTEANGYSYYTGKNGGSSAIKVLPDGKTNTTLKVNNVDVTMPTTTYYAMGIRGTSASDAGIANYGTFDFVAGENTFVLAGTDSFGLCYGEFYIVY